MSISLPPDIAQLMTTVVTWESSGDGPDGHGQWTYGPAIDLTCWTEPHVGGENAGATAIRKPDGTVVEPQIDLYFNGDDPYARQIQLWDRFTSPIIAGGNKPLQALKVETMYGPPFDNQNPWLIVVLL